MTIFLPIEIENIINDYKYQIEHVEKLHKSLKKISNINYQTSTNNKNIFTPKSTSSYTYNNYLINTKFTQCGAIFIEKYKIGYKGKYIKHCQYSLIFSNNYKRIFYHSKGHYKILSFYIDKYINSYINDRRIHIITYKL